MKGPKTTKCPVQMFESLKSNGSKDNVGWYFSLNIVRNLWHLFVTDWVVGNPSLLSYFGDDKVWEHPNFYKVLCFLVKDLDLPLP